MSSDLALSFYYNRDCGYDETCPGVLSYEYAEVQLKETHNNTSYYCTTNYNSLELLEEES